MYCHFYPITPYSLHTRLKNDKYDWSWNKSKSEPGWETWSAVSSKEPHFSPLVHLWAYNTVKCSHLHFFLKMGGILVYSKGWNPFDF